jgi:hypothetical protein
VEGVAKHKKMFSFGHIEPAYYAQQEVIKCALAEPDTTPEISSNLTVNFG